MKTISVSRRPSPYINNDQYKINSYNNTENFSFNQNMIKNTITPKKIRDYNFVNNLTDNFSKRRVLDKINSYKIKAKAELLKHDFTFTRILISPSSNYQNIEAKNKNNNYIIKRPKTGTKIFEKTRKKILEIQSELKNNKTSNCKSERKNFEITNFNHAKTKINAAEKLFNDSNTSRNKNIFTYNFVKDIKSRYFLPSFATNINTENNLFKIKHLLFKNKNIRNKMQFKSYNSANSANKKKFNSEKKTKTLKKDNKKDIGVKLLYNPESFLYQIYHNGDFPTKISPIYFTKINIKDKFKYFKKDLVELEKEANKEVFNLKKQLAINSKNNKVGCATSTTCFFDLAYG